MCKITYERETIFKNLVASENKGARQGCPPCTRAWRTDGHTDSMQYAKAAYYM